MTYSILLSSKHLQNFMEIVAGISIILALVAPGFGSRIFAAIERRFRAIARAPRAAVLLSAAFPLAARVALLPLLHYPSPFVHDEFSYLLLGDTFAHARIANPTPPEWRHFETEYVLLRPTYASQYQPAQGLLLAAGEVAGDAWWGVWLGMGMMFASICWALRQTIAPRWALFGAVIAAMQFGIYGFWMNSYFGGAVAATGSALVFGSLLRMGRRPASSGAICAAGLMILFGSRPFEAILWMIGAAVWIWLLRRCGARRVSSGRGETRLAPHVHGAMKISAPFAVVFLAGAGALATYNQRVTGDAFKPPYQLYREKYGTPQSFWWQPAIMVDHFDFPEIQANYENQLAYWRRRYSPRLLWDSTWRRLRDFWRFFLGPFLTPPLLFAAALWRDRRVRPWLFISALLVIDHATYHAWYPQQAAASTVLIVLMMVECWRRMRIWQRRRGFGLAMARNLMAGFAFTIVAVSIGRAAELHLPHALRGVDHTWESLFPQPRPRERALAHLRSIPGKHLVFVSYSRGHFYADEWVFNGADITGERVAFARIFTPESDIALMRALADHDVWLARPDIGSLEKIEPGRRTSPAAWRAEIASKPAR